MRCVLYHSVISEFVAYLFVVRYFISVILPLCSWALILYGEKTALVPVESIKSVSVIILILMLFNNLYLQDSSGIFWDNDSLAGLLAIELKADLLVLLSDVDGLYSGPPSEPQSKIIHTYIKEKHHSEITFGDKSRVGRGGMTAKVKAAFVASNSGTPVVITRY